MAWEMTDSLMSVMHSAIENTPADVGEPVAVVRMMLDAGTYNALHVTSCKKPHKLEVT